MAKYVGADALTPMLVKLLQDVLDGKRVVHTSDITVDISRPRQIAVALTVEADR